MKLIDREPTQEMVDAMWATRPLLDGLHPDKMFQAAYDAAPEVKQEPVAYLTDDFSRIAAVWWDNAIPVYALHPDAQAEIAKQAARIKELEETIAMQADKMKFMASKNQEQSAEIARLKGVVVKCNQLKDEFYSVADSSGSEHSWGERAQAYSTCAEKLEEALTTIKEAGL